MIGSPLPHETSCTETEKGANAGNDEMRLLPSCDGDDESLVVRIDNGASNNNRAPGELPRPSAATPRNRRMTRRQLVQRKQEFEERASRDSSGGRISATPTGLTKSTRLAMFLLVSVQILLGPSSSPSAKWGAVSAQTVGVDICACQPSTYEFVLDFGLTCEEKTVAGPGINASECRITTDRNLNVTDQVPISVSKVQVLELNQDLDIITTTQYDEEFADGDIFTYTSVIASNNITRPQDVPRALQMTITGRNAEEQDLVNFWIIIFDNSCGIYPVVLEGEQIGWTIFSGLSSPPVDLCPLAQTPTVAPVESLFPSIRPSLRPNAPPVTEPPVSEPPEPAPSCPPIDSPTPHAASKKKSHPSSKSGGGGKGGGKGGGSAKSGSKGKGKGGSSAKRSSKIHKPSSKMSPKSSAKHKSSTSSKHTSSAKSSTGKGGKGSSGGSSKQSSSEGKGKGSSSKAKGDTSHSKSTKKKEAYYGSMKKVAKHRSMISRLLSSSTLSGDMASLFKVHSPSTKSPVACPEVPTPDMKKTPRPVAHSKGKGGKGGGSAKSSSKKISAPPKSGKGSSAKSSSGKGSGGKGGGGSSEGKGSTGKGSTGKGGKGGSTSGGSSEEYEGDDADEITDDKSSSDGERDTGDHDTSNKEADPPAPGPAKSPAPAKSAVTFPPNPPAPPKQGTAGDSFFGSFIDGGGAAEDKDASKEAKAAPPPPPGNVFHKQGP